MRRDVAICVQELRTFINVSLLILKCFCYRRHYLIASENSNKFLTTFNVILENMICIYFALVDIIVDLEN